MHGIRSVLQSVNMDRGVQSDKRDNADNFDVLEEIWPTTGLGAVLTTSCNPVAKHQVYTTNSGIDLKPFSTQEAVEFMNTLTRRSEPPTQSRQDSPVIEVVNKLRGLPLLIT